MIAAAVTVAILAAIAWTLAACQQAEDAATPRTTTQERTTTNRGATNTTASSTDGPQAVTAISAWGNNYNGQLGDGTYGDNRAMPVKVGGLRGAKITALAGGQGHTLALKSDGTVLAWGYNRDGELGNGTNEDSPTPVVVKDSRGPTGHLSGVRAIAAGSSHSLALKDDGSVWAWGANDQGQLGNGTQTLGSNTLGISTPAEVKDLGGAKLVAAGLDYSLAGR